MLVLGNGDEQVVPKGETVSHEEDGAAPHGGSSTQADQVELTIGIDLDDGSPIALSWLVQELRTRDPKLQLPLTWKGTAKHGIRRQVAHDCCHSLLYRLNIPIEVFHCVLRHKESQIGRVL